MPKIYVASLTDYNAGILHGEWIDANQDADDILSDVQTMLATSPTAKAEGTTAEEWRIDDDDDFEGVSIGEWQSFEDVATIAELVSEWPGAIVAHMMDENNGYDVDELDDKIRDLYAGEFEGHDEESAIADYYWEGLNDRTDIPEDLGTYLNAIAEGMAHDAVCGGEMWAVEGPGRTWFVLHADH